MRAAIAAVIVCLSAPASAEDEHACLQRLDELGVPHEEAAPHKGVELPVEVTGPVAGVTYVTWGDKDLVLDCSLVYSLARAGRTFTEGGMTKAFFSSAYQRRTVRGTSRPSKHSFGLAIDLHQWQADDGAKLTVQDDYEQGLGEDADCIGRPLTEGGRTLRIFWCRLDRSGFFKHILGPDYDEDHYDHFHVEALPWDERKDLGR